MLTSTNWQRQCLIKKKKENQEIRFVCDYSSTGRRCRHSFHKISFSSAGPRHAETHFRAYADSDGPDQTAYAQSDQGLRCPVTESLDTIGYIKGE